MNQEQEKFQKSLRELLAFAVKQERKLTKEQAETFFKEQKLTDAQKAMVYEYLEMEQINIEGFEKKQTKKETFPLSVEEEHFIKVYLEELPIPKEMTDEEKKECFAAAALGDALAKSRLLEYYMPKIPEIARNLYDGNVFFGDLVQEGNVSLLLALEEISTEAPEQHLLEKVRQGIEQLMEEYRIQKHQDETMVHKVNRLKDAIEELSDGDEINFSVAELSAYLDMSVEEIEDILRLTGEEQ